MCSIILLCVYESLYVEGQWWCLLLVSQVDSHDKWLYLNTKYKANSNLQEIAAASWLNVAAQN